MRLSLALWRPLRAHAASVFRLDHYSQFHPTAVTMKQYVDFGQSGNQAGSFLFLRKEMLVRLANIMKEIQLLPQSLLQMSSARLVQEWYIQSFTDFLKYEQSPVNDDQLAAFSDTIRHVLERHTTVVETMAEALLEWKAAHGVEISTHENLQYFLDRFYLNRISIRMLMNQHLTLFSSELPESPGHVGVIHPDCDIMSVVEDAYHNAQFLCDRYYMMAPRLEINCVNAKTPAAPIRVQVVPSHLYHICFELFKNAMRATVEHCSDGEFLTHSQDDLPPVIANIVMGSEDLSIRISDRGGGVPRSTVSRLFHYMYSTAPPPSSNAQTAPLAGYGYGLPLSRLYARYFHGDLQVTSMEGYGSDAFVFLKSRPSEAQERVPIYGKKSIARLLHKKQALDYTEREITSTNGNVSTPPNPSKTGKSPTQVAIR